MICLYMFDCLSFSMHAIWVISPWTAVAHVMHSEHWARCVHLTTATVAQGHWTYISVRPSQVIKLHASKRFGDLRRSCRYSRVVDCIPKHPISQSKTTWQHCWQHISTGGKRAGQNMYLYIFVCIHVFIGLIMYLCICVFWSCVCFEGHDES